jgi:phage portal protein BeeE
MSFRLYSEPSLDAVIEHVRAEPPEAVDLQDNGENTDTTISDNGNETNSKVKMFSMWPGHKMRHGSTVQKAVYEVSQVMRYPHDESYLVVWCERRWITDPDYRQGYSIVVTLECAESADVNLYQTLQIRLAQEVRPRIRV